MPLTSSDTKQTLIASTLVYKFRPERSGFNMYAEYKRPQLTFLALYLACDGCLFLYLPIKAYCREQQLRRCSGSEQSGMLKKVSSCKFILSFIFLFNYRVSHET